VPLSRDHQRLDVLRYVGSKEEKASSREDPKRGRAKSEGERDREEP